MRIRRLTPDDQGRIALGDIAKDVDFLVIEEQGVIVLRPVPRSAAWAEPFEIVTFTRDESAAIQRLIEAPPSPSPRLIAAMRRREILK